MQPHRLAQVVGFLVMLLAVGYSVHGVVRFYRAMSDSQIAQQRAEVLKAELDAAAGRPLFEEPLFSQQGTWFFPGTGFGCRPVVVSPAQLDSQWNTRTATVDFSDADFPSTEENLRTLQDILRIPATEGISTRTESIVSRPGRSFVISEHISDAIRFRVVILTESGRQQVVETKFALLTAQEQWVLFSSMVVQANPFRTVFSEFPPLPSQFRLVGIRCDDQNYPELVLYRSEVQEGLQAIGNELQYSGWSSQVRQGVLYSRQGGRVFQIYYPNTGHLFSDCLAVVLLPSFF